MRSFHITNPGIQDMLGKLTAQFTAQFRAKLGKTAVYDAPLFRRKVIGPHRMDNQVSARTAPVRPTKP
jgi:hypothetical protein